MDNPVDPVRLRDIFAEALHGHSGLAPLPGDGSQPSKPRCVCGTELDINPADTRPVTQASERHQAQVLVDTLR